MPTDGILIKEEIINKISKDELIKNAIPENAQSCSYDLRVGTIFREDKIINESHIEANNPVRIKPGEIVSVFTMEELDMPADISGTAFPINSMSSEGLLVLNPGHVDPGFKGPLTVRALNLRKTEFTISRGKAIFTIIFEKLAKSTIEPYGNNVSRAERERIFHENLNEKCPKDIKELILVGDNLPFTTQEKCKDLNRTSTGNIIAIASLALALLVGLFWKMYDLNSEMGDIKAQLSHISTNTAEIKENKSKISKQDRLPFELKSIKEQLIKIQDRLDNLEE